MDQMSFDPIGSQSLERLSGYISKKLEISDTSYFSDVLSNVLQGPTREGMVQYTGQYIDWSSKL